jgi:hypothetical protein
MGQEEIPDGIAKQATVFVCRELAFWHDGSTFHGMTITYFRQTRPFVKRLLAVLSIDSVRAMGHT